MRGLLRLRAALAVAALPVLVVISGSSASAQSPGIVPLPSSRAVSAGGAFALAAAMPGDSVVLSLSTVVQRVLAAYPSAALVVADVEAARAGLDLARASRLPGVSLEAGGTRFQEAMIVAPLHGFDPQAPPEFDRLLVQGRAVGSYTLWDGGARRARIRRGHAQVEAAGAVANATNGQLMERAIQAYLEVATARQIAGAHEARVVALQEERARTERLLNAGSVPQVAVLRADAALAGATADLASALASVRLAETSLARLTGADADSISTFRLQSLSATTVNVSTRSNLVALAAGSDPAVDAARSRLTVAEAATEEARAAFWPFLALNGGYNIFGSARGDYVGEWQAAVRVTYPLFTGGARSAAVDGALASESAAAATHRQAQLDAQAAVDGALARLTEATARTTALSTAVSQFEAVVDVELLSLNAGAGVQPDYLRAVSDLLDTRAALTRALAVGILARVTLARVTGQLDSAWLARNLEVQ